VHRYGVRLVVVASSLLLMARFARSCEVIESRHCSVGWSSTWGVDEYRHGWAGPRQIVAVDQYLSNKICLCSLSVMLSG